MLTKFEYKGNSIRKSESVLPIINDQISGNDELIIDNDYSDTNLWRICTDCLKKWQHKLWFYTGGERIPIEIQPEGIFLKYCNVNSQFLF